MPVLPRDPLAQRIGHTDPAKYTRSRSHGSAGDMACETLLPGNALTTNLDFSNGKLRFDPAWNVSFGPTKPGQLVGELK